MRFSEGRLIKETIKDAVAVVYGNPWENGVTVYKLKTGEPVFMLVPEAVKDDPNFPTPDELASGERTVHEYVTDKYLLAILIGLLS